MMHEKGVGAGMGGYHGAVQLAGPAEGTVHVQVNEKEGPALAIALRLCQCREHGRDTTWRKQSADASTLR